MVLNQASAASVEQGRPPSVHALLQSTGTPFTTAVYERGAALFRQGDPCGGVLHIEKGRVQLVVTSREGREVLVVSKAQMTDVLRARPAMRDRLVDSIVARSVGLQSNLADQLLNRGEQRLARALLVLAGCDALRACTCELPRISQETIAEMVGTTRLRVNIFMGKFKKLGFIEEESGVLRVTPSLLHIVDEGVTPIYDGSGVSSSLNGRPPDSGHV